MFSSLKISAIAVGLFILFATSIVAFFLGVTALGWATSIESRSAVVSCILVIFALRIVGFIAAGYYSAQIAVTQPLLHGAICGLIWTMGWAAISGNWLFTLFFCISATITGAWLKRRRGY